MLGINISKEEEHITKHVFLLYYSNYYSDYSKDPGLLMKLKQNLNFVSFDLMERKINFFQKDVREAGLF